MRITLLLILFLFAFATNTQAQRPTPKNYVVFFDLSARIENPRQQEKDLELLKFIVTQFQQRVESMYKGGRLYSEDKLSILFYPDLENDDIISLTSSLVIDFSKQDYRNRLDYYREEFPKGQTPKIIESFTKIYDIALQQNPNYFGSNIYDFFSYSIENYLENEYNNHVILFTDGYMYMAGENPERSGNSLGHLEGSILDPLRADSNWEKKLKTEEWKIISSGYTLPPQTSITLLEITPDCINNIDTPRTRNRPLKSCPNEFKILTRLWQNWFLDMGLEKSKFLFYKTSNNLNGVKSNLNGLFD